MNFKYLLIIILLTILLSNNLVADNRIIRYGCDKNYAPFEFYEDGEYKGINIDLLKKFAKNYNYELQIESDDWAKIYTKYKNNQIDMLSLFYIPNRDSLSDFSSSVAQITHKFYYNSNFEKPDLNKLQKNRIMVEKSEWIDALIKSKYHNSKIVKYESAKEILDQLAIDPNQYAFLPDITTDYYIYHNKLNNIESSDIRISYLMLCFAVRKGNYTTLMELNDFLSRIKINGEYHRIYDKWVNPEEVESQKRKTLTLYIGLALLLFILIFVLIFSWSITLKKRVKVKTDEYVNEIKNKLEVQKDLEKIIFALDKSSDAVFGMDENFNLYYINNSTLELTKYDKLELLKLKFIDLIPEYKLLTSPIELLSKTSYTSKTLNFSLINKKGNEIPVEASISQIIQEGMITFFIFARDVSQRIIYENALKESEEQFRKMFFHNNSIMYLVDKSTYKFVDVNLEAIKFYGYTRQEFLQMSVNELNKMNDSDINEFFIKFKNQLSVKFEMRHWLSNGDIRDMELSLTEIHLSHRQLLFIVAFDITEQKRNKLLAIKTENKFSKIFHTSPDAIAIFSENGLLTDFNHGFTEILGFNNDDLKSQKMSDLNLWLNNDDYTKLIAQINQTSECLNYESKIRAKSGKIIDALISAKSIEINDDMGILMIIRDISQQKILLEQIANEREQLESTIKSINDSVIVVDSKGAVNLVNSEFVKLLDLPNFELNYPNIENILQIFDMDSNEKLENPLFQVIKSGIPFKSESPLLIYNSNNSKIIVSITISPVRNNDFINGAIIIIRDITYLYRIEQELKNERDLINTIFDNVNSLILALDKSGHIIKFNKRCETLTGFKFDEVKNQVFWDIFIAEHEQKFVKPYFERNNITHIPQKFELNFIARNGSKKLISWNTNILDNSIIGSFILLSGTDITEIREQELKLREMARSYEIIVEITGELVYEWDLQTNELIWYGNIKNILGYTSAELGNKRDKLNSSIHSNDIDYVEKALNKAMAFGKKYNMDYRIKNLNNNYIWVHESGYVITDFEGNPEKMFGMIMDIDNRKKDESLKVILHQISESTMKSNTYDEFFDDIFRAINSIFNNDNLSIILFNSNYNDPDLTYSKDLINTKIERNFKSNHFHSFIRNLNETMIIDSSNLIISENDFNLILSENVKEIAISPLILNNENVGVVLIKAYDFHPSFNVDDIEILSYIANHLVTALDHKSKSEELNQTLVELENRIEERTAELRITNDELQQQIDDRIRIENEIRESEERFRSMADNAPVFIWMTDEFGMMKYVNNTWLDFAGKPIEEILGLGWFDSIHPEYLNTIKNLFLDKINDPFEVEFRMVNKDGNYRWFLSNGQPRKLSNGELIGFIGSSIDITELKTSLQKEKDLSYMKSQFITTVSHEYRTPLTTILTSTYLLDKFIENGNLDESKKFLNIVQQSVNNMTLILDQVFMISKADAGDISFNPQIFDIHDFLTNLIDGFTKQDKKKQKIRFELIGTKKMVHLDSSLLQLIVSNLMTNAIKFSPNGAFIDVVAEITENNFILVVQDYGNGIPEDQIQYISNPFFRATNVGVIQGTGLGLSIVSKCISICYGQINFDSKLNEGTKVKVTLPYGHNILRNTKFVL